MALRGYAAFPKKVKTAPPGTFTIFDVRHGSKPWTLAVTFGNNISKTNNQNT